MPLLKCAHCGDETFTVAGWADLDQCVRCGRPPADAPAGRFAAAQGDDGLLAAVSADRAGLAGAHETAAD
ncbi:MAG TPA: hypothetical protein VK326_07355 [Solirubrobacterales bacterium]|nr:hypothetical protein [Solirubrobacterales bacterium]